MRGIDLVLAGVVGWAALPANEVPGSSPPSAVPRPAPRASAAAARSAGLDQAVRPAEAVIWYLGHCGYAVRTAGHLLVFDYIELEERPTSRGLGRGFVDPAEIRDLPVRVFVSHSHIDHFDPVILEWRESIPDILYFFGWQARKGERTHDLAGPRATRAVPGLNILTVNSRHAGVDEATFLVELDGLVVFHGGDYQGIMAEGAPSNAAEDMRYLRGKARTPDLMFLGAWTGDPYLDIVRGLEPAVIFPGHWRKNPSKYAEFADDLSRLGFDIPVPCPTRRGDRFEYRAGKAIAAKP
ncbi:MAG: hypothetical protein AB1625_16040 [Acidobacteriota bacterium]